MSTLAVIRKKAGRTAGPEAARHPCFDPKARAAWARVHLPVAPACNISCNFCDRRFDCSNESRPGVTSVVLAPWQALAYLDGLMRRRQDVAVVGIAGPGDPLANPDATLETLRLVRAQYPDLLLCLATNGLALAEHAAELARLHLSHLTITINTLDPATGARIYAWVRDGERVLRGEDGAALLLQRQLAALEALRGTGILIKVNSILIPGINDEQIPGIAAEVKRRGAHLFNCMALIPAARTPFASLPAPDPAMVSRVRSAAGAHLPLMEHCSRCRADACGLLNEGTAEISLTALLAAANLPHPAGAIGVKRPQVDHPLPLGEGRGEGTALHVESRRGRSHSTLVTSASGSVEASPSPPSPSPKGRGEIRFEDLCPRTTNGHVDTRLTRLTPMPAGSPARPYIAVATREGLLINDHLGEAESFAVFAPEGSGFRLVENRVAPPAGTGVERWRDLAAGLADCKVVLVAGVGPVPRRTLESGGLRVVEAEGLIEDALEPLFRDAPLPASMARRFESCGNGCGGTGQGCG